MSSEMPIYAGDHLTVNSTPLDKISLLLTFKGLINEDFDFGGVQDYLNTQAINNITFDFRELESINSCGVREWLLFLQRIEQKYRISFQALSEAFIEQINIVPQMIGKQPLQLSTIAVPFLCQKCNDRKVLQVAASKLDTAEKRKHLMQLPCQKCKNPTLLDVLEEEYFNFFNHV